MPGLYSPYALGSVRWFKGGPALLLGRMLPGRAEGQLPQGPCLHTAFFSKETWAELAEHLPKRGLQYAPPASPRGS